MMVRVLRTGTLAVCMSRAVRWQPLLSARSKHSQMTWITGYDEKIYESSCKYLLTWYLIIATPRHMDNAESVRGILPGATSTWAYNLFLATPRISSFCHPHDLYSQSPSHLSCVAGTLLRLPELPADPGRPCMCLIDKGAGRYVRSPPWLRTGSRDGWIRKLCTW